MVESFLIKGILIGLLFGMPIGAVGALTTQRILFYGPKAGIISGMGSSAADCIYACIGVFGLTFVSDILMRSQIAIHIIGGLFILLLGIKLVIKKTESMNIENKKTDILKMFLSSFAIGITNPTAILTFLFGFSYFEISGNLNWTDGIQVILGVFSGTFLWWLLLAAVIGALKNKKSNNRVFRMNKIFGTFLILLGVTVVIKAACN